MARRRKDAPEASSEQKEETRVIPSDAEQEASEDATASQSPAKVEYDPTPIVGKSKGEIKPTSGVMTTVYSKWQHDLVFDTPFGVAVIRGTSKSKIIGAPYTTTLIPVDAWNYVVKVYGRTKMFKNHFVFAEDDAASGEAHVNELVREKTGLEGIEPGKSVDGVQSLQTKNPE